MLARQSDRGETALDQAGMEMPDIVARRAEQHRRLGLMQAQQIDHGILDVGGRDGDRLIADIAMPAILADGRDAQRILLIALGERDDRLGHRRREHQRAPRIGRGIEDQFEILAETHVEHLVGFVENHRLEVRQIERAAFDMVAQAARRANDDMRTVRKTAAFAARVHPADAGRNPRADLAVQPFELATDLQRQFARRRNRQRQRRARRREEAVLTEQLWGNGEAERDGLARAGLRRNDQVAAFGLGLDYSGLNRGGGGIATGSERFAEKRGEVCKGHDIPDMGAAEARARVGL